MPYPGFERGTFGSAAGFPNHFTAGRPYEREHFKVPFHSKEIYFALLIDHKPEVEIFKQIHVK